MNTRPDRFGGRLRDRGGDEIVARGARDVRADLGESAITLPIKPA
jgi:hypothetical protein